MQARLGTFEDLPAVNALKENWYGPGTGHAPEYFRWAFFDRVPEPSKLICLEDAGRLVGTQAIFPVFCRQGDRRFLTFKSEETLVDREYRGKGLFKKMYHEIFRETDEGADFIWGVTPAKEPFNRLGFASPTTSIYTFLFTGSPTKEFPLGGTATSRKQALKRRGFTEAGRFLRLKTAWKLRGHETDRWVSEQMDLEYYASVWDSMCRQYSEMVSVDRNPAWLQWRLEKNPARSYRMLQYHAGIDRGAILFATDETERIVYLVDFVGSGQLTRVMQALVAELAHTAQREGYAMIIENGLDVDLHAHKVLRAEMLRYGAMSVPIRGGWFVLRPSPRLRPDDPRLLANRWFYTYLMSDGSRV